MMFDDATRLILAAVAGALLARTVWLLRQVNYPGRRVVLYAWLPALAVIVLFSLSAAFDWWTLDWRRWLSQVSAFLTLGAVFVMQQAMRTMERTGNDK